MRIQHQRGPESPLGANGCATIVAGGALPAITERQRGRRATWLVLLIVWVISLAYAATVLRRGWIPRDEGLLAHSAERVLHGEVPHKDFQDAYVGALTYLHAFAFSRMGTNLASLRFTLFAFFALFVPALYWITSRLVNRMGAAAATLIAVAWSIPTYGASMPSWYNLFFATYGLAAIFYYLEMGSSWLLLLAGLSAGISCLFKITGLYFVAAVLLFFVWRSQIPDGTTDRATSRSIGHIGATVGVLAFFAAVVLLLRSRLGRAEIYHFLLPQLAIGGVLLWREWRSGQAGHLQLLKLVRVIAPFLFGLSLPLAAFAAAFARMGALPELLNGVFILPTKRLALAARSPAHLASLVPMAVVLFLVLASPRMPPSKRRVNDAVLSLGLLTLLILSTHSVAVFTFAWFICATLIPAVVMLASLVLCCRFDHSARDQHLMLLAGTVALCSLMQYPFSNAGYFCYVAPLLVLAVVALVAVKPLPQPTLWVIGAFGLLFPVVGLRPFMERDGFSHVELVRLQLPRAGGLEVRLDEARDYEQVIRLIQEHVSPGSYIYVAPDDPQVYFLAGMRNPTKIMYSLFDDPQGQTGRILHGIATHDVHLVVIDTEPILLFQVPPDLLNELHSQFPHSRSVGHFQVRWRP